jgi:hypothetical protein
MQLNNTNVLFLPHRKPCVSIMDQMVNFVYVKFSILMFVVDIMLSVTHITHHQMTGQ